MGNNRRCAIYFSVGVPMTLITKIKLAGIVGVCVALFCVVNGYFAYRHGHLAMSAVNAVLVGIAVLVDINVWMVIANVRAVRRLGDFQKLTDRMTRARRDFRL